MRAKIFLTAFGISLLAAACFLLYYYTDTRVETSTIDYIEKMQRSPNKFNDLAKDINVSSADDIGFIVKDNYVIDIFYGEQIIRMTRACFQSKEYRTKLAKIGIKVYVHVNPDDANDIKYRVTYWDTDVDELSRIN